MKLKTIEIFAAVSCLGIPCFLPDTGDLVIGDRDFWQAIVRSEKIACPDDVKSLTALMLKDLPHYANRVIQRSRQIGKNIDADRPVFVIMAGREEFEPLPSSNREYRPLFFESPEQVFFTTLERQYALDKAVEVQTYHWLFLSKTSSGWRMVMLFSQFGRSYKALPPSPPQESSNSAIGRAIALWLRDCRANSISRIQIDQMIF